MIDEREKDNLRLKLPEYVMSITRESPDHERNKYICPLCGSGTGKDKSGAFSIQGDGIRWKCFSCDKSGDIFDLIRLHENQVNSFPDAVRFAQEYLSEPAMPIPTVIKKDQNQVVMADFTEYIRQCHAAVNQTPYLHQRGFTDETIDRFMLGFDAIRNGVVIPYGRNCRYYIMRYIHPAKFRYYKPPRRKAGSEPLYNIPALYDMSVPCFITEGQLDSISIMQAGAGICSAIAYGGGNMNKFLLKVREKRPATRIILFPDNDDAGQQKLDCIRNGLDDIGIPYVVGMITGYKDANDKLQSDPDGLRRDIQRAIEQ